MLYSFKLSSKLFYFLFLIFFYIGLTANLFAESKNETIIVRLNNSKKHQNLVLSENLKPAVLLPKTLKKSNLLLNSDLDELMAELSSYYYLEVPVGTSINKIHELESQGITAYKSIKYKIEQDNTKINDPLYKSQWSLPIIQIENAWKKATGKNVVVGVIDTGIDPDHEDLANQLWINPLEDINGNGKFDNWSSLEEHDGVYGDIDGIDNDGNGFVDDIIGFDFVDKTIMFIGDAKNPDYYPFDENRHGTAVASVIAAEHNNNKGITGIAFDSKIMTLRAFDVSGNAECKDIANAIIYAAVNGVDVINMSFGEYMSSPLMHTAIKFADALGCILIASSGNEGTSKPHYPSDYDEVISVGGCNEELQQIYNYGNHLDITAPARNIYSATPNNNYNKLNGTSFAAPIVSSVAALLKEKNKELTTKDIRNIFQYSASKIKSNWTPEYGAGIINAYQALKDPEISDISITYPENNSVINISKIDTVNIVGSVFTPLFNSYLVRIKKESFKNYFYNEKEEWDTLVSAQNDAKINTVIGSFYTQNFSDSLETYTLSLLVNLKNGSTLETRNNIKFCSDNYGLKINKLSILQPFFFEKRVPVINIQTNALCNAYIYYKKKTDSLYNITASNTYYTNNHTIMLKDIPANTDYDGYVLVILPNADTVKQEFEFNISNDYFEEYSFYKKEYELPRAYLYDKPLNIDINNSNCISLNLLSSALDINMPMIYKFDSKKKEFVCIDSTNTREITVAGGDSNGDGKIEILAGSNGQYKLFQKEENQSIYNKIVFSQPNIEDLVWGEGMIDINCDGNEELIFVDNSYYFYIYSFDNNEYILKAKKNINEFMNQFVPDSLANSFKIKTGIAIGDFDNDGNAEIALTSYNNDYLLIIEIDKYFNSRLKDYLELENYYHIPNSHFIASGDFDNDGKQDILYMYYGKCDNGDNTLGESEVWTYSLFKYDNNNKFIKAAEDDIYGVRISDIEKGIYFRNGLTAGNLDNKAGDEAVICAFPNLYVLTWNEEKQKFIPLWSYPNSLANKAVIGDFDNNGINEIGFASFASTCFYEFNENHKTGTEISNFDGWSLSNTSAYFTWQTVDTSLKAEYELWLIETENLLLEDAYFTVYKTNNKSIKIDNLVPNTKYTAYVKVSQPDDYFSLPKEIYLNDIVAPIAASYKNQNKLIEIKFNGLLPIETNNINFRIYKEGNENELIPYSNCNSVSDSVVAVDLINKLENGIYNIYISSFRDFYGNYTKAAALSFNVNEIENKELFLTRLEFTKPNIIILEFSEAVDSYSSTNIDNYTLKPYCSIENIEQIDSNKVKILLHEHSLYGLGKDYLITASRNISSKSGLLMTEGVGNTLGFSIYEDNIDKIIVYPSPISLNKHDEAYIGHLTQTAKIEIMTIDGKILRTLEELDGNGGINWDLRDNYGNILGIGVYIIKATDTINNKEKYTKFTIIK